MDFTRIQALEIGGKKVTSVHLDGRLVWPIVRSASVSELIEKGWAQVIERAYTGNVRNEGYGITYYQIQILPTCPLKIEDIVDFPEILTNSEKVIDGVHDNYFVWNLPLPAGWDPEELMMCYDGVALDYIPSGHYWSDNPLYDGAPHWFDGVDMSGVESLTIVVNTPVIWNALAGGVIRSRLSAPSYKVPQKYTFKLLSEYSSIMQSIFCRMSGTKEITLDCSEAPMRVGGSGEQIYVRDMSGLCESDFSLEKFNVKGNILMCNCENIGNMFHGCAQLREIPLFAAGKDGGKRDGWWNTWVVRNVDQAFAGCGLLESIQPCLDMASVTFADACANAGMFSDCGNLHDVRLKHIKGSWDFTGDKVHLPYLDTESINYILNNTTAISNTERFTLKFSPLHGDEVDPAAIAKASSRGYDVVFS